MMKNTVVSLIAILCFHIYAIAQIKGGSKVAGKVNAGPISIAYESFGSENNEVILLIGGTGSQLTDWPAGICEKLANKGYRVIRFDNRDAGLSSKLDSLGTPNWAAILPKVKTCDTSGLPYALNDMAGDALGLLEALKIEKAHLVGVSMGGAIAQLVAINHPERTLSLTSIAASSGNPNLPPGDPKTLTVMATPPPVTDDDEERAHYLFNIFKAMDSKQYPNSDTLLKKIAMTNVKRSWYPEGSARQAAAIIIADNCDRRNELKKIGVPTVVIHGDADPVVNVAAGKEVAAAIQGARLIILPGMGHAFSPRFEDKIVDGILTAAKG